MGNNEKKRKGWKNISTRVADFMDIKRNTGMENMEETESDAGK